MTEQFDVVIVGAGLAGAGTAWAATRRGLSVLVIEQFTPANDRGSSHGSARIVRRAYGDGLYVSLTGHAFELWREVEHASGQELLRMYGGLDFGPQRHVPTVSALLAEQGVPHEVLSAGDAQARWLGMRFDGEVVFHQQAGTVDAAAAVDAMLALAAAAGAELRYDTEVRTVTPDERGATLRLSSDEDVRCAVVVVAAGGWLRSLVGDSIALPSITVTQQQTFHFPRRDPAAPPWPSVIHEAADFAFYHLAGGAAVGQDRKIGQHGIGRPVAAGELDHDGVVDPVVRKRITSYVRDWLPGLLPEVSSETTCLYTETPSEDFLIDRVGAVVLCSPCSGHGAKFAPLVGELTTDLITGARGRIPFPKRFRLEAHRSSSTGAVSL